VRVARVDDGERLFSASVRRADVTAIKSAGKMPFDFAQDKPAVRKTKSYGNQKRKLENLTPIEVSYIKARPFRRPWKQLC